MMSSWNLVRVRYIQIACVVSRLSFTDCKWLRRSWVTHLLLYSSVNGGCKLYKLVSSSGTSIDCMFCSFGFHWQLFCWLFMVAMILFKECGVVASQSWGSWRDSFCVFIYVPITSMLSVYTMWSEFCNGFMTAISLHVISYCVMISSECLMLKTRGNCSLLVICLRLSFLWFTFTFSRWVEEVDGWCTKRASHLERSSTTPYIGVSVFDTTENSSLCLPDLLLRATTFIKDAERSRE